MAYDRADFDYSSEDIPLPKGHAATHIGMFLAWAVFQGLVNDYHRQRSPELIEKLLNRVITGREFFESVCQGKFSERDLNPEGNAFAEHYYRSPSGERGAYFEDYRTTLAIGLPSFWHVADTWLNYDRIAPVVQKRYQAWKNPSPKRRWWQFWK